MNIEFLVDYMNLVIFGLCLLFGFVVKKWVKDVDNKWIPTLCCVLGVVLAIINDWGAVGLDTILTGGFSGLASTGFHQLFKQLINEKTEKGGD